MARLIPLIFLVLPFLTHATESISKASQVKQVTIYRSAAEVEREAKVNLQAGSYELVFPGLSSQLYDQSFQVSGTGDFQILSISSRVRKQDAYKKESKYIRLAHELDQIDGQIHSLQAELDALQGEEHLLGANKSLGGNSGIDLQKLQSVSNFYRQRLEEIHLRKYAIQKEQQKVNLRRSEIQEALNQFIRTYNSQGKELVLKIESPKPQELNIQFSYIINQQVNWADQYDLYFEDLKQDLKLHHKALVSQSSGEDWLNVSLSFSTGSPTFGGNLPVLSPYFLSTYYPQQRGARAIQADEMRPMALEAASAGNSAKISYRPVSIQDQSLNRVFHLSGKHSIPSGSQESIRLSEKSISANFEYRAIPKLSDKVFLEAQVKNWEDLELQGGEVQVYNQGSYVNRFYLSGDVQDEMRLSLGVDPSIKVSRVKVKDQQSSSLLGSTVKKSFNYRISVKSLKNEAVEIEILDQVPISKHDKVEVEILNLGDAKLDPEKGELSWKISLSPKGSEELNFAYEIRHPKDFPVVY